MSATSEQRPRTSAIVAMQRAEARGDLRSVRRLAHQVLESPLDAEELAIATSLLEHTRTDAFLSWVSVLGLMLLAGLVYSYLL